jgi:hypothetical protein
MKINKILIYDPGATEPRREPCGPRPGDIMCGGGAVDPATHDAVPELAAVARRIAPWATWIFAPTVSWRGISHGGLADWQRETGYLKLSGWSTPAAARRITCHEAWHLAEALLTDEAVEAVYASVAGLDPAQPHEAAARIFEWMATSWDVPPQPDHARAEQIMRMVWNGSVGREVMADRARQARRSTSLMERVRTFLTPWIAYTHKKC